MNICGIAWPRTLHVIAATAAASLLYKRLKSACTGKEHRGEDGEAHIKKVKSIGGAAYAKAKDSFSQQHHGVRSSATLLHSGCAWGLRYVHKGVWRAQSTHVPYVCESLPKVLQSVKKQAVQTCIRWS